MTANIAEFTGAMDKAAFVADQRSRAIARAINTTVQVVGRTAAVAGALLTNEIRRSLNIAEDIKNFSQSVGLGIEEFQRLGYAAQQNGVAIDEFRSAMARFANAVTDDAQAFKAMGVATRNAAGQIRPVGDVLRDVADEFAAYRDGAEKTALAQDLFGRSGSLLIPTLNEGADGLRLLGDEAERAGLVMSGVAVVSAAQLANQIDALKGTLRGVVNQIMIGMLPALTDVGRGFAYASGQTELWQQIGSGLGEFVRRLGAGLTALAGAALAAGHGLMALYKAAASALRGEFREAWTALAEGKDSALLALYQGLDKAAVMLNVGTASVIDQRRRLESEANRAAAAASRTVTAPTAAPMARVSRTAREEESRVSKLAAMIEQLKQSYRDLLYTREEQLLQDARALGATEAQVAEIERLIAAIAAKQQQDEAARVATERANRAAEEQARLYASFPDMYYEAADAAERYRIDLERLEQQKRALIEAGRTAAEVETWFQRAVAQLGNQFTEAQSAIEDFAHAIGTAFEDAILSGKSLSSVLKGLLQDILRIIIRTQVTIPLQNYIMGALGGGGGGSNLLQALAGLLGLNLGAPTAAGAAPAAGNTAGAAAKPVIGPRATGGIVRKGELYLVGERGPEIFSAFANGRILSNANLLALSARENQPPAVRQVFNITTPNPDGFRLSQRQIVRQMRRAVAV